MDLSLHQLTALDATPRQLIEIAGRLSVPKVCLFTHVPEAARGRFPVVSRDDVPELQVALGDAGVQLCNLEVFPLDRSEPRPDLELGLEIGAELGATRATAHIHDVRSEKEAIDRFAAFAATSAAHGIVAGLEFNAFSAVRDIEAGARIVRAVGRGSLVLDMLHLMRSGGTAVAVASAADIIGYAQLCDELIDVPNEGRWREAVSDRLVPGEGEFPLEAIVGRLRTEVTFEVEVPQSRATKSGVSAFERAGRAVDGSRRLLAQVERDRA